MTEVNSGACGGDAERYRQAALQAERMLEAREASYRHQIMRLENQVLDVYSEAETP